MKRRDWILAKLERGDIAFAVSSKGQGMMMLVHDRTETTILTRHVPSQTKAEFDQDGKSNTIEGVGTLTIKSAAPLPPDTYNIVLGLDRKMRLLHSLKHIRLTDDEKRILQEAENFYTARPLPEGDLPDD
jgi:hypothetical protein